MIPEEKSSFSVDSSNDDFIEDEEEENAKSEKINNINSDWKSRKNLQNNDIKTRSVTPKQEKEIEEEESEKSMCDENVDLKIVFSAYLSRLCIVKKSIQFWMLCHENAIFFSFYF